MPLISGLDYPELIYLLIQVAALTIAACCLFGGIPFTQLYLMLSTWNGQAVKIQINGEWHKWPFSQGWTVDATVILVLWSCIRWPFSQGWTQKHVSSTKTGPCDKSAGHSLNTDTRLALSWFCRTHVMLFRWDLYHHTCIVLERQDIKSDFH